MLQTPMTVLMMSYLEGVGWTNITVQLIGGKECYLSAHEQPMSYHSANQPHQSQHTESGSHNC